MSTAPLAMLVMDGVVAGVRFSIVGWIEIGLTPLRESQLGKQWAARGLTVETKPAQRRRPS